MSQQIVIIEQTPAQTLINVQVQQPPIEEMEEIRSFVTVPMSSMEEPTNFELIFLTSLL